MLFLLELFTERFILDIIILMTINLRELVNNYEIIFIT